MLNGIQNIIASPTFYNMTQGTTSQMAIKTGLNSIGRPGFILMDKKIDPHTKKFSATKEFLYQVLSLCLYLGLIMPGFKKGAFSIARLFCKNEAVFKAFHKPADFKAFHKLSTVEEKIAKIKEINEKTGRSFIYEIKQEGKPLTKTNRKNIINEDSEDLATGVIETSSLVGTALGLAVIAPLTASKLIHPILKLFKLDNDNKNVNNIDKVVRDDNDDNKDD